MIKKYWENKIKKTAERSFFCLSSRVLKERGDPTNFRKQWDCFSAMADRNDT